ncbi:MAG: glycosyltransferase [Bryobacterales bacterium]|nr:glycosyltransferase [Bryobacterales bacterium]
MPVLTVSCIMPTRNRRALAGQAIAYFLRQDYPSRELIIVDDGEDSVADLAPAGLGVRHVRVDGRMTVGAKRNLACRLSSGDLIAHWDDDDWMPERRLSTQVAALAESGADVCGLRELLHYRMTAGEAWLYRPRETDPPGLAGCTLLYKRSVWAGNPFPEINAGEDAAFLRRLAPGCLHAIPDQSLYVALIHSGNTGAKNLADPRWERRPLDEITRLLAWDGGFYAGLRNGGAPGMRRPAPGSLTVAATFDVSTGYGAMAEYLVLGLARAGATVHVAPLHLVSQGLGTEFRRIAEQSRPEPGAPVLYFHWPMAPLNQYLASRELFINTMWESSLPPPGWAPALSSARGLIVPARFLAASARAAGIEVPVEVIPEGIDPAVYHYEPRPQRAGLTTLIVAPLEARKHTREAIAAWKMAFQGDPGARLIIKTQYNYQNYTPDDPRITYVDRHELERGIAHWYREADLLLAAGSEGFGLPLVEGMATGLPVIALNSEGQADVCREAGDRVLAVSPERFENGSAGVRGVPGIAEMAAKLRWVAAHREEAREMGRRASEWAAAHRSIWNKGPAVLDFLESRLARPLRRAPVFWNPSAGSECGVAEYTARLAETIGPARVTKEMPDTRSVRVLHIQHEGSLFNDAGLAWRIQQARAARVPVVATLHAVEKTPRPWEQLCSALVSLTARGADRLCARWPGKRVEHIPCGCPEWFPPRKASRGRVIGAFGFLAPHKGFWRLLDALRAGAAAELLLFSRAHRPELEASWERAAQGLPVRRVGQYLPLEEIARRLASEADALVFWYDEAPFASASSAISVGLASGVPVLASPTGWFEDLGEAAYRPHDLVEGLGRVLEDTALRGRLSEAARDYCRRNNWQVTAGRHLALWRNVESN